MEENFFNNSSLINKKEDFQTKLKIKKLPFFVLIVIFLAGIFYTGFYFWQKEKIVKLSYLEAYRLVPEKISQSAKIPIYLPENIEKEYAKNNIKFEPKIKGRWVKENNFKN